MSSDNHALVAPKMRQQLIPFSFNGQSIRVINRDDEPWFVASDVCRVLEHSNPTMAVQSLDEDERAKHSLGRQGEAWIISESGLFALVLTSRKPEAKPFRRWVTGEVLPTIRKTGRYDLAEKTALETQVADLRIQLHHAESNRVSEALVATHELIQKLQAEHFRLTTALREANGVRERELKELRRQHKDEIKRLNRALDRQRQESERLSKELAAKDELLSLYRKLEALRNQGGAA